MNVLSDLEQQAMLDSFWWNAEQTAQQLGMPHGDRWAYLWTPIEVHRAPGTVEVYAMLSNGGPSATVMRLPFREVSAAEGFCFKMLGQVVTEPTATTWAICVSPEVGGFVLIEPWYMIVPIGAAADAWLRRMPEGIRRSGVEIIDQLHEPDDATLARARRALTMTPKHAGGRPPGATKGRSRSRREILEWYEAQFDEEPDLQQLADWMGLRSRKTARARVDAVGLHWPPTPEELDELLNE